MTSVEVRQAEVAMIPPTPPAWPRQVVSVWRKHPGLWLVPAVMFVASASASATTSAPILCVYRLVTGVPCPGCGLTRGFVAIGHGLPHVALDYNLLAPVLYGWMVLWWLWSVAAMVRGGPPASTPRPLMRVALVVLVAFWLLRGTLFLLRPDAWQAMQEASPLMRWLASFT